MLKVTSRKLRALPLQLITPQHYELLQMLIVRTITSKYKQTFFQPVWFIVQPLLTTAFFTVVFGIIIQSPTAGVPPALFYLSGLVPWHYTVQNFTSTARFLLDNANLLKKTYFPRLLIPIAIHLSHLHVFLVQLSLFTLLFAYIFYFTDTSELLSPNLLLLALPLLIIHAAAISFGMGLWIAILTTRYRDLQQLVSIFAQGWLYATPIIYPLSTVPSPWRPLLVLNPLTMVIELYRHAFLGTGIVSWNYYGLSLSITALLLISSIAVFRRVEKTAVDTL